MKQTVSVIMATYNGSVLLRRAVDSILNQTFHDMEFIIIDDASTDETPQILSQYQDPRLILISNEQNLGLTKSLNKGIRLANGKYIARQDADDESLPERLERQVQFMEQHPDIGLLGTYTAFIDERDRLIDDWILPTSDADLRQQLETHNVFCHGSTLIRRAALEKSGLYREKFRYTQDYELWLRLAEITCLANLPELLYRMHRGKGTISRQRLQHQLEYQLLAWELAKERRQSGKDRYETLKSEDPGKCLREEFGVSDTAVSRLKNRAFKEYFKEALFYMDYSGALKLRWQAFQASCEKKELITFVQDVVQVLRAYLEWQYHRHIAWRFK